VSPKPLDGLRVVDLTHVLAGPYCTYQLGLLGADVVKVESLKGDMVRGWGGTEEQLDKKLGSGFVPQNAGKKSVSIDIRRRKAQRSFSSSVRMLTFLLRITGQVHSGNTGSTMNR